MSRGGFAIADVLVAAASALLVAAMIGATVPVHARAFTGGRDRQELRSSVRRVVDAVAREARSLGFDPIEAPLDPAGFDGRADGIAVAEQGRLEIRSDHHGAGGSDAPNDRFDSGSDERIAFAWSASTRGVTEAIGGLVVPLAQGATIRSGDFRLRYFDACGRELVPPPAGLGDAERRAVDAIEVSLSAASTGAGGAARETMTVALRNRRHLRCPIETAP